MSTTKKKQRKIDWDAIKTEYVTSDISQRKLAEKYKLDLKSIERHCKEEQWVNARKECKAKVMAKTTAKFINKESTKRANKLESLLESSYKLADEIQKTLDDPDQFNRYMVQYGHGKDFDTEERIYGKKDIRAMRELTQTIRNLEGIIRSINNQPTEAEAQRLRIEKERWEKEKADASTAHEVKITFDTDELEGWTE